VKGSDKAIVMGVIFAVILAGFYFKVLSPKREKASALSKDITELQAQVDEQKQLAQFGEDARQRFPSYYGRLVVLGKAVPSNADTPSLLVQLNSLAERTGVKFNGLTLSAGAGGTAVSGAPTASSPSAPSSGSSGTSTTSTTPSDSSTASGSPPSAATTPTAATEATAANLPLGATVGAAGLPVMPYDLIFEGSYFDVTDFLKQVDDLVRSGGASQVSADGRLLTVNSFSLELSDTDGAGPSSANPQLQVSLSVTSYLTPGDQGAMVGTSPAGPTTSLTQPQTQPTSATVAP
jgi:Tfp pilus assembly protein PilO